MELEFDKEIDAILRKARPNKGVLVGDDPPEPKEPREQKPHLDADAIAAFADNALPEKARLLYIAHFADCDPCRKLLSRAVQMNAEADAAEKRAAPSVSAEPEIETVVPWYESIFRTPNLALGMGALVLVFSGILGYLILQRSGGSNATVSQIAEPEDRRGGPYDSGESNAAIPTPSEVPAASSANAASNSAMMIGPATNTAQAGRTDSAGRPADSANTSARSGQFQIDGASGSENNFIVDGQETTDVLTRKKPAPAQPVRSQPQAGGADSSISSQSAELLPKGLNMSSVLKTAPATDAVNDRNEKKADAKALKEEDKDRGVVAKRKQAEDRGSNRDAPPASAKVGPARSGPLQNQSNQSNVYQMSVTRVVGGKTFSNRSGAWYDSAYSGQATTNFRRGTGEYKALDSGLRKIADTIGGTVVIVWKAKAYRIQ